MKGGMRHHR